MKRKLTTLVAASCTFAALNASAFNLITNGDFETGDLTGWDSRGDVRVADFGDFSDFQGMDDNFALLGFDADDFFPGGGPNGEQRNSLITQDFSVAGIDQLKVSFNWAFDFFDVGSGSDVFLAILDDDGGVAEEITLERLRTNGRSFRRADIGMEYGFYEEIIDISDYTAGGEADITFRLRESRRLTTLSAAGIDNVYVANAVPEASTYAMFGTAFLMLGFMGYYRSGKGQK